MLKIEFIKRLLLEKSANIVLIGVASLVFLSCKKSGAGTTPPPGPPPSTTDTVPSLGTIRTWLVDKNATDETAVLFYNLKKVSGNSILFGHQDDTKRGVTNATTQWANEQSQPPVPRTKSDVLEVTGSYPAVYGLDFIHIANFADGLWYDYEKQISHDLAVDAYNRGGIVTYCWHYANPVSKGSFYWDQSPVEAVSKIIPGGSYHNVYKASLTEIADFARSLVGADGKFVPVIFRPFHEFDGDWFWWGKSHCSIADFKSLYQFTVSYLRDSLGVRNFLYAFSPDRNFTSEATYLERYPGDAYVDIVGMDNYWDLAANTIPVVAGTKLKILSDYAKAKNKIAAMTETGSTDKLGKPDWYTDMLLKVLTYQKLELAYVLVWSNSLNGYYTPYKGHPAEKDFIKFKNDPYVFFADRLPRMYQLE